MAKKTLIRDLVTHGAKTIREDSSCLEAAKCMAKHNIGAVIVVNKEGEHIGIFTERDLLKRVVAQSLDLSEPVSKAMTCDLVCAQLHDELMTIPQMMVDGGFRHVPVMDGFELVGILSMRDMLRHFSKLGKGAEKKKK